jgi:hypothetical protein
VTTTELEALVVRLTGDASSYQKMLTDVLQQTKDTADRVEGYVHSIASAFGAIGLTTSLKGAFDSFSELERKQIRLKAAIEASGAPVNETIDRYKKFSKEITDNTTATKGEIYSLIERATNMGKTGDAVEEITKRSLAFGAATGHGAQEGFRLALALEMGNAHMLRHALGLHFVKDESEVMRIAQQRLTAGFKVLGEENNTASAKIEKLGRAFGEFKMEMGKIIAEAITPFLDMLTKAVERIRNLSPFMKTLIVITLVLVGTLLLIPPILSVIATIWHSMTGGMLIVIGLLVTAAVGVAALAAQFGGLSGLFGKIKEKALAAWEWLKPIRQAVESLWDTIVTMGEAAWVAVKEMAVIVWNTIAQSFGLSTTDILNGMTQVRDYIVMALLAGEWAVKNYEKVAKLAWIGSQLQFISFADKVIWFFQDVLPPIINWFGTNWKDIIGGALSYATEFVKTGAENWIAVLGEFFSWFWDSWKKVGKTVEQIFSNIAENLSKIFKNLKGLVKGTVTLEDLNLKGLGEGIDLQFKELDLKGKIKNPSVEGLAEALKDFPEIAAREIGPLEARLREEFNALAGASAEDFQTFFARRMTELARKRADEAHKEGLSIGNNLASGAKQGADKLELVLRGSAEALSRIIGFNEKLAASTKNASGFAAAPSATNAAPIPVVVNNPAAVAAGGANPDANRIRDGLLLRIAMAVEKAAGIKPVELKPAGIA